MDELRADDPRWIGAYRLVGRLGSGSMGRVYLARSERGRTVAVKLVRPHLAEQDEFRARFRREVRAARRVGSRWTAPVLDADTDAEVPWVATGYVAGPSLREVVAKEYGPLPEHSVRVLAAGLTHALADIHAAGLVHRDLKPSNVMITIDGPRVIDFGIARALETVTDGSLTQAGATVGSPGFMSPEQVRGDRVTPACDVFCLGSVLAYAATGLPPFGAGDSGVHAQMFRVVQEQPDLSAVPAGLRALVAACLAKDPEERPSLEGVRQLLGAGSEAEEFDGEPWLPGAIVARLGRDAVRLLELEAEEPARGARADAAATVAGAGPEGVRAEAEVAEPAGPPGKRRGPLVAALTALVVVAGGATAYIAVHESGERGGHGGRTAATGSASASASAGTSGVARKKQPAGVTAPAGIVGTWQTTFVSPEQGDNTRTLTIHADGSVELTGEGDGYTCAWTMRVVDAGQPAELSPSLLVSGQPASSCSGGQETTLELVDATHLRRRDTTDDKAPLTYTKIGG